MAKKKSKSKGKHKMDAAFPGMGSPMDVADHPVNDVPSPQGGAFNGAQLNSPGAPMVPGMPM